KTRHQIDRLLRGDAERNPAARGISHRDAVTRAAIDPRTAHDRIAIGQVESLLDAEPDAASGQVEGIARLIDEREIPGPAIASRDRLTRHGSELRTGWIARQDDERRRLSPHLVAFHLLLDQH